MTKLEKLKIRILSRPSDFTFDELDSLLKNLGYVEQKLGKTAGSRKAYYHYEIKSLIRLHKPHPGNILKKYVVDMVVDTLTEKKLL